MTEGTLSGAAVKPGMRDLSVLDGHLRITADGRTVELRHGGLIQFAARLPLAVEAVGPSRLQLTVFDPRLQA